MKQLTIILILISGALFAQRDSIPVEKTLKDKPIPKYPDSNSIYKSPDTNAIYNEQQGFHDKYDKSNAGNNVHPGDSLQIKKPTKKKTVEVKHKSEWDNTKVVPKKINKKSTRDTTGNGSKQNF